MTKYLSKEPMFFGPPRRVLSHDELMQDVADSHRSQENCPHTHQVFTVAEGWHCKACGTKIEPEARA